MCSVDTYGHLFGQADHQNISTAVNRAVDGTRMESTLSEAPSLRYGPIPSLLSLESLNVWGLRSAALCLTWWWSPALKTEGNPKWLSDSCPLHDHGVPRKQEAAVTDSLLRMWSQGSGGCGEAWGPQAQILLREPSARRRLPSFWAYWHAAHTSHGWNGPFLN